MYYNWKNDTYHIHALIFTSFKDGGTITKALGCGSVIQQKLKYGSYTILVSIMEVNAFLDNEFLCDLLPVMTLWISNIPLD